jgi:hypothetical protein
MNTINSLIVLLQYIDLLSADLNTAIAATPAPSPGAVAARKERINTLLADAASDLSALTASIGHEFGGGE